MNTRHTHWKWIALIALLALALACGGGGGGGGSYDRYGGHSAEDCQTNWDALEVDPGDESLIAGMVINREHLPDTIGEAVKECLQGGWRWDQ